MTPAQDAQQETAKTPETPEAGTRSLDAPNPFKPWEPPAEGEVEPVDETPQEDP